MEQAVRELEQSETHDIAAKLGQHWRLVFEYSDCFRQSEFGNVSMSKRLRIFKDIARLLDALIFSYRGKRYRTSWHEAIKAMTNICNAQKWGFHNHNYLLSILVKTADRLSIEGLTAKEEAAREEERSLGHSVIGSEKDHGLRQLDFKKIANKVQGSGVQGSKGNGEPLNGER
jgi:hypothetical protein